jgi:hypothetical protein
MYGHVPPRAALSSPELIDKLECCIGSPVRPDQLLSDALNDNPQTEPPFLRRLPP